MAAKRDGLKWTLLTFYLLNALSKFSFSEREAAIMIM